MSSLMRANLLANGKNAAPGPRPPHKPWNRWKSHVRRAAVSAGRKFAVRFAQIAARSLKTMVGAQGLEPWTR